MKDHDQFERLSTEVFKADAWPVLQGIFNFSGNLLNIFPKLMSFRMIDVQYGALPEPELLALLNKIASTGNYNGFYYVFMDVINPEMELWLPGINSKSEIESWYIPFEDIEKVRNFMSPIGYAMFSPKGEWGIFVTTENFLLLGCTQEVGEKIKELAPNIIGITRERFFKMYKQRHDSLKILWDWLPILLRHLYGNDISALVEKYQSLWTD